MRILRMALVGGFAGALMASNVPTLYAAPLPTNVASMKSKRLVGGPLADHCHRTGATAEFPTALC